MPTFTTPKKQLTWLITGCSSGLGLSLTRVVQANGHKVLATSRNPSRTPSLVAEVEGKGGKWLQLDVDDPHSARIIDDLYAAGGEEVDVLVNNAGCALHAPVETATEAEARAAMETLYFGPLRLIRAVVPRMRRRRFGVVVNFSSGAALDARDSMGVYGAAKAALDGAARALAKEVAPFNIRVLTVVLGVFNTNLGASAAFGATPLPDDYEGSAAEQVMHWARTDTFPLKKGDKDKAMQALYQVVVGEGVGRGLEAERILPLGCDMTARVQGVRDDLDRSLRVFSGITNSVSIDE